MYRESESMVELHKIREQMYEDTKGMTVEGKIAFINKAADEAERKYGLHLRKATSVHE